MSPRISYVQPSTIKDEESATVPWNRVTLLATACARP